MEDNVGALGDRLFIITGERDHYLKALEKIEKGEGPFSIDPLTHAINTIEAMKAIATDALKGGCDGITNEIFCVESVQK